MRRKKSKEPKEKPPEVLFKIYCDNPDHAEFIATMLAQSMCNLTGKTIMGKIEMVETPILVEISAGGILSEEHISEIQKKAKGWEGKVNLSFLS